MNPRPPPYHGGALPLSYPGASAQVSGRRREDGAAGLKGGAVRVDQPTMVDRLKVPALVLSIVLLALPVVGRGIGPVRIRRLDAEEGREGDA